MKRYFTFVIVVLFSLVTIIGQEPFFSAGFDDLTSPIFIENGRETTVLGVWKFNNNSGNDFKIASLNPSLAVVKQDVQPFSGNGYLK